MVQGKNIYAHQLMLCAASPYFKETILAIKAPPGKYSYKPRLVYFLPQFFNAVYDQERLILQTIYVLNKEIL